MRGKVGFPKERTVIPKCSSKTKAEWNHRWPSYCCQYVTVIITGEMLTVLQVYPNCGYGFVSPSFFLAFLISPHLSTLHWKIFTILNLWFNILSYMFLVLVIKRCKITNIQWRKFSWPALFPYQLYSRKEWLCYNESFPPRKHFLRTCRLLLVTLMRSKQSVTTTIMIHTCFNSAVNSERSHILFMLWDKYPESRCPLNVEVKLEVKHDRLSKYIYLAFVLKCQHSGCKSIFFFKSIYPQRLTKQQQQHHFQSTKAECQAYVTHRRVMAWI